MRSLRVWASGVVAFTLLVLAPATAAAQGPSVSLTASAAQITAGSAVTVSGTVSGAQPGTQVQLSTYLWPYVVRSILRTATPAADGAFSFKLYPDRNVRYRAQVVGTGASATVQVAVAAKAAARAKAIPLGRAKVTIVIFHPRDLNWAGAHVWWFFASGSGPLVEASSTLTRKLSPYALALTQTIALPAGRFRWQACFKAAGTAAMAAPDRPKGCHGQGYHGSGFLPTGFPGPAAISRAEAYLASRGGRTALAVVDSEGRLSGVNLHEQFITGSVVKAMLLVAYLRRLDAMGQHYVDPNSNSILYPMIHVSDNTAASDCWSIVGNSGLYGVAAAAGMTEFSVTTDWGSAMISAADQARFFFEMDSLIPPEFVTYARGLLSGIAAYESWGIPAIARPLGYEVFFKGGWRPSPDIYLVHQIARLEGHGVTFAMAVMTDGDADMSYGIDSIQGTTQALLG